MISLNPKSLRKWQDDKLEFLRYEYPDLKPGEYAIDIGAYQREWANEMIRRYKLEVECFEAMDNRAAWTHNGEIQMGGQFYYTSMFDKGELGAVKTFQCVDIAPFLNREVAIMKVNCEGAEYELLNYIIDSGLVDNIRHLQVQFHLIEGVNVQSLYTRLSALLSKTHRLKWIYPFCWESWERKSSKETSIYMEESAAIDETVYNDIPRNRKSLTNNKIPVSC